MKKIILIILTITIITNVFAQKQDELPTLTKQQMLEDFNYLYEVIKDANPQLTFRKKVTGVDILENIKSLYSELDTITQFEYFYLLVEKALNLCHDMHYSTAIPWETQKDIDEEIIALNRKYDKLISEKIWSRGPLSVLKYYNGNYYFFTKVMNSCDDNKKEYIEVGSQLIELGGMPIDDYVAKINPYLVHTTVYDRELKKFFTIRPVLLENTDIRGIVKDIDGKLIQMRGCLGYSNIGKAIMTPQVQYFTDTKVLYIRIPGMDTELIDYFKEEIPKIAKDKEINKTIIDVRVNGGGSDFVWHNVLSNIIKDTVKAQQRILLRNTPIVLQYLKENKNVNVDTVPIVKVPCLDNEEFIDYSLIDDDPILTISPSENSIKYSGKIFLLVDEWSFSSTLNFLEVATLNPDKFVTIGEYGGYKGGQGGSPFLFALPNSKITFRIDAMIDYNNVEKAEDFFHGEIMYPVKVTVNEYHNWRMLNEDKYDKEFLYNKDPMFKKVLELK